MRRDPLPVHRGIVGTPCAGRMLGAEHGVERAQFQVVGDGRLAGQPQGVDHHGLPGDDAAGFDGVVDVGIAGRLLAGGEAAGVSGVEPPDAGPVVQESGAERLVAGDAVQFDEPLQAVQALPAWAGRAVELFAGQSGAIVVARRLEVLEHLLGHAEVAGVALGAIDAAQAVNDAHVHLGRAGVLDPKRRVEARVADHVGDPPGRGGRPGVAGLFAPEHQAEHHVVVSPQVPVPPEPLVLRPRAEVAVVGLEFDQTLDDVLERLLELRIAGHGHRLHARDEVLAHELAGPGHQVGLAAGVAPGEHVEQAGVILGGDDQPVLHVGLDPAADEAVQLERGPRDAVERQLALLGHRRGAEFAGPRCREQQRRPPWPRSEASGRRCDDECSAT